MYTPENLNRWTRPDCYFGAEWPEYYSSGIGQSRESEDWEIANFRAMRQQLDEENRETVIIVREDHWAVGWVEWIAIHESDEESLKTADEIAKGLEDYPIIDEEIWSEVQMEEEQECWSSFGQAEFIDVLKKHWEELTGTDPDDYSEPMPDNFADELFWKMQQDGSVYWEGGLSTWSCRDFTELVVDLKIEDFPEAYIKAHIGENEWTRQQMAKGTPSLF